MKFFLIYNIKTQAVYDAVVAILNSKGLDVSIPLDVSSIKVTAKTATNNLGEVYDAVRDLSANMNLHDFLFVLDSKLRELRKPTIKINDVECQISHGSLKMRYVDEETMEPEVSLEVDADRLYEFLKEEFGK